MPRTRKNISSSLISGLLVSILCTLLAMFALAALLLAVRLEDGTLRILNQLIKLAAIVIGVCVAIPRGSERGLATGTLIALAYSALGYGLYAALGGKVQFANILGELMLGVAAGAVTGVIRANMHPKKRRFSVPARN